MESKWKYIDNQNDIDELMEIYHGFHDSAIINALYKNNIFSDENGTTTYCQGNDYTLSLMFNSCWEPNKIELVFAGVRQIRITGYQDNYIDNIFGAYLSFDKTNSIIGTDKCIIWADDEDFNLDNLDSAIKETRSYVIADRMKWRIVKD